MVKKYLGGGLRKLARRLEWGEASETFGVGVWKEIMAEANWCWHSIKFKVGKGTRVKLWTDQ